MNISRLLVGATLLCALPVFAQTDAIPPNGLPYRFVTPEEAAQLVFAQKPISLHLKDVTLRDALKELAKQSDITLTPQSATVEYPYNKQSPHKIASVDIETPFFEEALSSLSKAAHQQLPFYRTSAWRRWAIGSDIYFTENIPVNQSAGFSLRLLELNASTSKHRVPRSETGFWQVGKLDLNFLCRADPRWPVWGTPEIRATRVMDEAGHSLAPWRDPSIFRRTFAANSNWESEELSLALQLPDPASKKLTVVEGNVLYVLGMKPENWTEKDVTQKEAFSHDFLCGGQNIRVVITDGQLKDNRVKLRIAIIPAISLGRTAQGFFPLTSLQLSHLLHLKDANGTELTTTGYDWRWAFDNGKAVIQANFAITPDSLRAFTPRPTSLRISGPVSLSLDLPTEFVQTEVPFSFSDLPLP